MTTQSENITAMTPAEHLEEVLASYDENSNPRLVEIMRAATRHLHAFVEETGITREEWFEGIKWLTAVGQKCDDVRQEFILLSDTLGVSMLVEMINQEAAEGTTEPTVFGPFHMDGAMERELGSSLIDNPVAEGEELVVTGTVRNLDGDPIPGATVDVWQTAANGLYSMQEPEGQDINNARGIFHADEAGRFEFTTDRPVKYQIPGDGPVGEMLHATGRHNWRPAHIHFMITAPGYKDVITHLFDSESDFLDTDAVFGVRKSLVVDMTGGRTSYDFVLEPA
jgi:hydroxyquinol 1,2-dioxygenase